MSFVDMTRQMKVAVETCLNVKPGDEVLIVSDTQMSDNIKNGLMAAAQGAGGEPQLITLTTRLFANQEVPRAVAAALMQADKIILATSLSMNHTKAVKEATAVGKAFLSIPIITEDVIRRTWPTSVEELDDLKKKTKRMAELIDSAKEAKLTSPEGTDITVGVGKYKSFYDCGIIERPGLTTLPGGLTATCPTEGTANGQFVIDMTTGFPGYRFVRDPITCKVRDGEIIEITGGRDAEEFRKHLQSFNDPNVFHIGELGTGSNPRCKYTGNPHDDEKKPGSVRLGIGTDTSWGGKIKAKTHLCCIMSHITMQLDGKTVIKNGELQLP